MIEQAIAYRLATTGSRPRGGVTVKRGDAILDGPYPQRWSEFVGQDLAVDQILAAISSASKRNTRMDHTLLDSGSPGIGKTSLARLAAHTLDVGFVELGGIVKDKDVEKALKVMQDGDILFLDEIHRLVSRGKANAEWLLTLMQDGELHLPTGVVTAPNITIVGATTDGQKLPAPILDRFFIKPVLVPYSDSDALQIARITAARNDFGSLLTMPKSDAWLVQIAKACSNNPRRMGVLLAGVRDSALAGRTKAGPNGYDISTALKWNGLTEDGLTKLAQEYLVGLWTYNGSAGIASIKALLNTEQIGHTENDLIRRGYVNITSGGRQLSEFGQERAEQLARAIVSQMEDAA